MLVMLALPEARASAMEAFRQEWETARQKLAASHGGDSGLELRSGPGCRPEEDIGGRAV
jgi:hypothetical protein